MSEKQRKPINHREVSREAYQSRSIRQETPRGYATTADEEAENLGRILHTRSRDRMRARRGRNHLRGNLAVAAALAGILVSGVVLGISNERHGRKSGRTGAVEAQPLSPVGANLTPGVHRADALKLPISGSHK